MIGPERHANTEAFKQWALAEDRPDAEWVITRKDARELVALAERAGTLERELDESMRQSERAIDLLETATVGWREEMDAKDRLREALRRAEALAAEWLQDALGGTMEEALAEIRARLAAGEGTPA